MGPDMTMSDTRAEVTRRFGVPPERVFGAFASADLVARWLSPSADIPLHVLEYDFRVHGAYRFAYHVSGGAVMHVHGTFREVQPPSRLIFSWIIESPDEHAGIDSEVRVSLSPVAGGCALTIVHERLDRPDAVERHTAGWMGALNRLEFLLRARTEG
jgi:uncharacterized protein YndB with AHSA1/START domain